MDAAVLDVTVLDAAVLDALVLDVSILDVVNTPYEGRFWMSFGGYEHWMLRFWTLRKLDATLLDTLIATR